MGVNTCIYLSPASQLYDVASAIGILVGLPVEKNLLFGNSNCWYAYVRGVTTKPTSVPEMAQIDIRGKSSVVRLPISVYFHFETEIIDGGRLLSLQSQPIWLAVGCRLVDFFGGYVDYNDSDDKDVDYCMPIKCLHEIAPNDNHLWSKFQERLADIKPLTEAEIESYRKYAVYDD